MTSSFITQGVEAVQKAIEADNNQEYEKAIGSYIYYI